MLFLGFNWQSLWKRRTSPTVARSRVGAAMRSLATRFSAAAGPEDDRLAGSGNRLLGKPLAEDRTPLSSLQSSLEDPHPSPILAEHEKGDYLGAHYDLMMRHPEIRAAFERRRNAVTSLPRFLVAAGEDERSAKAFDFVRESLRCIPNFQLNLGHQLDAVPYGLAVDELVYERLPRGPLQDAIVPVDMIDRPLHRFGFKRGVLHVRSGDGVNLDPRAPHPWRFLVHRHGTKDNPWGEALLDCLYEEHHFSTTSRKDYAFALTRWAQPLLYLRYDEAENEQLNGARLADIKRLIHESGVQKGLALPSWTRPDTIEAKRSASISYTAFLNVARARIFLVVCGETGETSGASDSGPGSYAKLKVIAEGVVSELVKRDAHALSAHLTDHLIRPLVALNLGVDWLPFAPKFFIDAEGQGDIEIAQNGLIALLDENEKRRLRRQEPLPIPKREIYQTFRVRPPERGEEILDQSGPVVPTEEGA